ncbi:MAG: hypothetical protein U0Q07_07980 [Acidimicrobiales bacterium]
MAIAHETRTARRAGRRWGLAVAVTVGLGLTTVACGKSDTPSDPQPAPTTAAPASRDSGGARATTAAPGTTRAPGTTSTTKAGGSTSTTATGGTSSTVAASAEEQAFCTAFKTGLTELFTTSVANLDENDPAQVQAMLTKMKAFFGGLAPQAPTVIKADWDTINAEVQKTNSLKDMQGSGTQAANDASDRVAAWSKATCGFDPSKVG